MSIAPPPAGSPWIVLHEAVHIWNVGKTPLWINEGMADFVSWLIMKKNGIPFSADNTWQSWISRWRAVKGTAKDKPLNDPGDNYKKVKMGKAMDFFSILYPLYGPQLIRELFQLHHRQKHIGNRSFAALLKNRFHCANPQQLLSGWITRGPYLINSAAEGGQVRYSLP